MAAGQRIVWIDVGRGACIILVTVFHVGFVVGGALGPGHGVWAAIDDALLPLRMPLFFLISGVLASNAVRRPLSRTRRRTLGLVYLYVLWSTIQLVHLGYSLSGHGESLPRAYEIVASFVVPTGLWFFWALALYFLVARLLVAGLGRFAPWVLVPLTAVSMTAPLLHSATAPPLNPVFGGVFLESVYANALWFFLGVFGRRGIDEVRRIASVPRATLGAVAFVALYLAASAGGVVVEVRWVLSVVALATVLQILALVPEGGAAVRMLAGVGRRTLPIYAMQWMFLHLLAKLVVELPWLPLLGDADVVASVTTPVFAGCIVACSWWLGGVLSRSPLRWLIEAPRWIVGREPISPSPQRRVGTALPVGSSVGAGRARRPEGADKPI